MQRTDVMHVLNNPLAQELIGSNIPARVAYTSVDGSPRAAPLGFHWNGEQFVICSSGMQLRSARRRRNEKGAAIMFDPTGQVSNRTPTSIRPHPL